MYAPLRHLKKLVAPGVCLICIVCTPVSGCSDDQTKTQGQVVAKRSIAGNYELEGEYIVSRVNGEPVKTFRRGSPIISLRDGCMIGGDGVNSISGLYDVKDNYIRTVYFEQSNNAAPLPAPEDLGQASTPDLIAHRAEQANAIDRDLSSLRQFSRHGDQVIFTARAGVLIVRMTQVLDASPFSAAGAKAQCASLKEAIKPAATPSGSLAINQLRG